MDYETLIDELKTDPAGIGYTKMTDAERLAALVAENQPIRVLASRWQVKEAIYLAARWPALLDLQSSEDTDLATLARTAVAYLSDPDFERINLDYSMVVTMLDKLAAVGLLTPELRSLIHGMGDSLTSRAAILGLQSVQLGNMTSARKMMEVQQ